MRNPVRITNRALKKERKKNPALIVGEKLRTYREKSGKTQLELAKAVTDILDVRRIINEHFDKKGDDYIIDAMTLQFLRNEILWVVGVCNKLETIFGDLEDEWIRDTLSSLLNVERLIGARVERERTRKGLVQRQLSEKIDRILGEYGTAGPPNRAGISKVERGERGLDLVEAAALAIALNIELEVLLPEEIVSLLPKTSDPLKNWNPLTVWDECRVYHSNIFPGCLTLCAPEGFEVPDKAVELSIAHRVLQ